jgi:HPt (histidine-containing phosphotransfer) domain-containing protein
MIKSESEKSTEKVCNLSYLTEMTGGKKTLIKEIIDVFLKQVPKELRSINDAIKKEDHATIKSFAHTMKSTVSIMGISKLASILQEMEDLGAIAADGSIPLTTSIEKIKQLYYKLDLISRQAIEEMDKEKLSYI